ncbi:MAG TPA: TIGR03667 family PPOX class F420-dependent oxidoreductase [Candidatus Acidoferrales bacterium]|nr:TIGR03667 family PPOX class F420-dependent oxidoreductase [Candidatus Acidoferrales bacterium]
MLDFDSRLGRRIRRRLREEKIIWLTTVDAKSQPQPRPVWFHWDGATVLIFSEKDKAKLRHIAGNPNVALNFNTDEEGGDVGVLLGEAKILAEPPEAKRVEAYLRKYAAGIKSLDLTAAEFRESYAVPILVTPRTMRGFVD